jgi:hypothetical protein
VYNPYQLPVHVLQAVLGGSGLPAEQHHHAVRLGGDETKHEHVSDPTAIALQHSLPQGTIIMQGHLLVLGPDKVVDYVAARCVPPAVTEPPLANFAVDESGRVVYATTVAAGCS